MACDSPAIEASTSLDRKGQRELSAILARLAELLAKAKVGTTINSGDIVLQIENDGKDPRELAIDIRRALEDLSMADFGRTDRWGRPETERPESSTTSTLGQLLKIIPSMARP